MMSKRKNQILFAILFAAVLPGALFHFSGQQVLVLPPATEKTQQTVMIEPTESIEPQIQELFVDVLMADSTVKKMPMEAYLTGVVLQEMPADFEVEAMKAQAVVARTYTLQKHNAPKHENALVCTDSSCCQGYISPQAYLQKGGSQETINKVRSAVSDTKGLVITYHDELIEATYFSCSGGRTEDALAVWGTDVPYLQSTLSPGEESAVHFTDTVTFSKSAFSELLGGLSGEPERWVQSVTYTSGGGVEQIRIAGREFKGTEIRQLLGLRSTAFVITAIGDTVTVTTKGFGHRVGMSQYGADAMAAGGSSFEEILSHYYQGTSLEQYALYH